MQWSPTTSSCICADRVKLLAEVARLLADGGRFLFTDAGVLTGVASNAQLALRSMHGFTCFVAPGFNERALAQSGLRVMESEDRTEHVCKNARGRLSGSALTSRADGEAGRRRRIRAAISSLLECGGGAVAQPVARGSCTSYHVTASDR